MLQNNPLENTDLILCKVCKDRLQIPGRAPIMFYARENCIQNGQV